MELVTTFEYGCARKHAMRGKQRYTLEKCSLHGTTFTQKVNTYLGILRQAKNINFLADLCRGNMNFSFKLYVYEFQYTHKRCFCHLNKGWTLKLIRNTTVTNEQIMVQTMSFYFILFIIIIIFLILRSIDYHRTSNELFCDTRTCVIFDSLFL